MKNDETLRWLFERIAAGQGGLSKNGKAGREFLGKGLDLKPNSQRRDYTGFPGFTACQRFFVRRFWRCLAYS
jgi:hypothetical protein